MLFKSVYRLAAVGSAQRIAGIDPNELIPVIQKAQQNIGIFAARTAQHLRDPVANLWITIAREPFKFGIYGAVDICTLKVV